MKKYIAILILLMGFENNSNAVPSGMSEKNSESVIRPIHIRINFDIAHPSECENGVGICRASGSAGRTIGIGRTVEAECYIEDNIFIMNIPYEKIGADMQKELEISRYFNILSDFEIPEEWLSEMKINTSFFIPVGDYKVEELKDSYQIDFTLK